MTLQALLGWKKVQRNCFCVGTIKALNQLSMNSIYAQQDVEFSPSFLFVLYDSDGLGLTLKKQNM